MIHYTLTHEHTKTILGIDPGTKEMGIAVLRGRKLLAYGVHTLRNGERPYDVIGQARRVVLEYLERYAPEVVAIEAPLHVADQARGDPLGHRAGAATEGE